jgi:thiamine biosynthesis protein ThiI
LVRYCEIGLKSTPVRRKFESILRDNMLSMLASDGVEALITYGEARFYLESDDIEVCARSVKKVFGVASVSITRMCSSDMEDICRTAEEFASGRLEGGRSFAVRARREGTHRYTSMELAKEAGSAIFEANKDRGITVDLTSPDKVVYIEVRDSKAYVFDEYIPGPGGLPMGSQGKVIADIAGDRGTVSAWMMMRRGCRVLVTGEGDTDTLKMYDPGLRILSGDESKGMFKEILAKVSGAGVNDLSDYDYGSYDLPVFFPTVGMTDEETSVMLGRIREASF